MQVFQVTVCKYRLSYYILALTGSREPYGTITGYTTKAIVSAVSTLLEVIRYSKLKEQTPADIFDSPVAGSTNRYEEMV